MSIEMTEELFSKVDDINDDSEFEDPFDKEHPNGFKSRTMSFGDASPEQMEKNKELAEEGFEIKTDDVDLFSEPLSQVPQSTEDAEDWKERYYSILEILNTFK